MAGIPFTNSSLWGYVKNRVYSKPIVGNTDAERMNDLKDKIREAFRSITLAMLGNVFQSFKNRLEDCEKLAGAHVEVCRIRDCANCNR